MVMMVCSEVCALDGPRSGTAAAAGGSKLARATSRALLRVAPLDSTPDPGHKSRVRSRTAKCVRHSAVTPDANREHADQACCGYSSGPGFDAHGHPTVICLKKSIPLSGAPRRVSGCSPHGVAQHSAVWSSAQGFKKVMMVQGEDIKLIRQIVASDGRKYTAGNIDRSRYDRLVDLGWLTPFKTNISDVEYQVTEKGRAASVDNAHD